MNIDKHFDELFDSRRMSSWDIFGYNMIEEKNLSHLSKIPIEFYVIHSSVKPNEMLFSINIIDLIWNDFKWIKLDLSLDEYWRLILRNSFQLLIHFENK